MLNIIEKYKRAKITAVIRTEDMSFSLKVADALIKGGVDVIEVTVENPKMYGVVRELSEQTDALIVAGGVITARQANEAIKAGAKAIVSPIFCLHLVKLCQARNVPLITTATTPPEPFWTWTAPSIPSF